MNVGATGSMQQMQMHGQGMRGAGKGQGNGMRDIMQSLSPEDRTALRDKMSSLSQTDRQSMISQMKEVDKTSMGSDEYAQTLLSMLDQSKTTQSATDTSSFSIYA